MDVTADLTFGEWLKRHRKFYGLTQEDLARQLHCSTILVRKIEAEERRPSAQIVERLAEIFHISPNERKTFLLFARGDPQFVPIDPRESAPWIEPAPRTHSNVPAPVTSLVGREKELAQVREYIHTDGIRLVTLIGPPGIGKTRLGLETLRQSLSDFPDGVFFIPLDPIEKPSQVASAIFQTLGYVEAKNQFTVEQLMKSIGDKKMLILLDNLEHLIEDSTSLISRLLSACPHLKILTTSRESLRVPGEWLYPVTALAFPKDKTPIDLMEVDNFSALTLFAERAGAVNSDFSLTPENVHTVASICARLDGVPLAIELLASRLRFTSPQGLLEQMNEEFIMSADGRRAISSRQQTLRNAILWSYNLLSSVEQEFLQRLAVFSGGFTMNAAEAIFAGASTKASMSDLVGSLLDKSLLQRSSDEYDLSRFNMLTMIREFGLEQLRTNGQESVIRDRHLAYFIALAEQADQEIHGLDQLAWIERIERNHNNFQAALDWCVTNQYTEYGLRLLGALGWAWWIRGHYSETRYWFDKIRALPGVKDHPAKYALVLNRVGGQSWNVGNDRDAQSLLEESELIWLSLDEYGEPGLADCLNWMSLVAFDSDGDAAKAGSLVERSIALYTKHADPWGCAMSMLNAGYVRLDRNRSISPLSWFEESLKRFEQVGDLWGKSNVYQCIGRIYLDQGKYKKARFCFEQQMTIDQSLRNISGIIYGLSDIGHLYLWQGDADKAEEYYQKSLATCWQYGLEPDRAVLFFLGMLSLHQNDFRVALQRFIDLYKSAEANDKKRDVLNLLSGLAATAGGTNQFERSAILSGAAQVILDEIGYKYPGFFRAVFDRHLQVARDRLGERIFHELASEGRAMTMERAIAYALEENTETSNDVNK
jgi:predicted ATPase/transcriptional regulator with XRE-family HTH domain